MCFHPWCGVGGKLCIECAQLKPITPEEEPKYGYRAARAVAPADPGAPSAEAVIAQSRGRGEWQALAQVIAERDEARADNDDFWMLLSRVFAAMPGGLRDLDFPVENIANVTPEFATALRNVAIRIIRGKDVTP